MSPPIGVLCPVRLETVADYVDGRWLLLLRVVPDEVQIDRHDPRVTDDELDALEALWSAGPAGFDEGFAILAQRFGGARAAWLVRAFPSGFDRSTAPRRVHGGTTPDAAPGFATVSSFPSAYQVWALVGGVPQLLHEQSVLVDELTIDPTLKVEDRWSTSWKRALAVGLGAEIDLDQLDPTSAIEALIVVGIDEGVDPAPLFAAHRDAGRLAVLDAATATNTVAGAPTVDLTGTGAQWRAIVDEAPDAGVAGQLGFALTGATDGVGPILGGERGATPDGALVAALWPALWGFAAIDLWNWNPDAVHEAGAWAADNLRPLGPLPAVRVGDQPYGILPATALARWQAAPGDPAVEAMLTAPLQRLRAAAASAAEARGTTTAADARRWLDLLGDVPWSDRFGVRWLWPLELAERFVNQPAKLDEWWRDQARALVDLVGMPGRPYFAISDTGPLEIALVDPVMWNPKGEPNLVAKMLDRITEVAEHEQWGEFLQPLELFQPFRMPNLSERYDTPDSLLIRLIVRSLLVAVGHAAIGAGPGTVLDPVVVNDVDGVLPRTVLEDLIFGGGAGAGGPAGNARDMTVKAVASIAADNPPDLELAFRALLDTASHRIDPWVTGIAWRRLLDMRRLGAPSASGIYGWVDGPLVGTPGPTPAGLLLATSDAQARTMAVLRDKAIHDPDARWQMHLDSATTAAAVRLADDVRLGVHPGEALGRRVEAILDRRDRIDLARKQFPLGNDAQQRRVCDGLAMLEPGADLSMFTAAERDQILGLQLVVDAYSDLLVADGVHQVILGRPDAARRSMEAAAGLALPPDLDVVRSPRPGRAARTTVLVALPFSDPAAVTRPAALADAAVADHLDTALGAVPWTWTASTGSGDLPVTLADLGLQPADAIALGTAALDQMVIDSVSGTAVTTRPSALDTGAGILLALRGDPWVGDADADAGDVPLDELLARYRRLRESAKALRVAAQVPGADAVALLVSLRPWGVTPTPAPGESPDSVMARAIDALGERLHATPREPTASDPAGTPEPSEAAGLDARGFARAIVALACPGAPWPVLARRPAATLAPLQAPTGAELEEWLGIVAAVRPRLAGIDAYQLDATPFTGRLDRPGDVWQITAAPAGGDPATRLVAAFGPPAAFANPAGPVGDTVAVGLADDFVETIPASRSGAKQAPGDRVLTAAVGFNAPAARAPQAVLLAVPPDVDQPLDGPTLVDIVIETRALAHARVAGPLGVEDFAAGAPIAPQPMARRTGLDLSLAAEL